MPRIRRLTISDYQEITRLWEQSSLPFKPQGRDSKREIAGQMKRDPELFLGAFEDNLLLGTVVGSYDGRKGWINRLAVDPRYRRQGIAEELIAEVEKALKEKGARIICALVEEPNQASVSLFKKLGYATHRDILYVSKRESEEV
ncbi:GNAT family N-acetyltransferase [Candidatus Bathyarchaeota archaeon]|nr:GNAT family N-acetyltransferase [Candidatus Bathyarchaeota archaeon]NIR16010.1 GNAT family N-acetyltransferase [Desulfobacterales bacterium]NIU81211.1 GNAT family N-acetyltransferase [Candidatus Bathyarchaeota archaeon]NIV67428.1 GNAT family N-acetyltransferase [Candidatus Bathyarchaeota archaeon]NIW16318.1 GNAT family N-acetyltransferase [Candidatus Bathyarchaeota archaeon]